jgi:hypothetical protein
MATSLTAVTFYPPSWGHRAQDKRFFAEKTIICPLLVDVLSFGRVFKMWLWLVRRKMKNTVLLAIFC